MKKPRKHADVIKAWADGAEIEYSFDGEVWFYYMSEESPAWDENVFYRIRINTININGYEVPEPVREPLKWSDTFYLASTAALDSGLLCRTWCNHKTDYLWLKQGLIHLTLKDAELHCKALCSFTTAENTQEE